MLAVSAAAALSVSRLSPCWGGPLQILVKLQRAQGAPPASVLLHRETMWISSHSWLLRRFGFSSNSRNIMFVCFKGRIKLCLMKQIHFLSNIILIWYYLSIFKMFGRAVFDAIWGQMILRLNFEFELYNQALKVLLLTLKMYCSLWQRVPKVWIYSSLLFFFNKAFYCNA